MEDYTAFTAKFNGIARVLKTPCLASIAHNPVKDESHPKIEFIGLWDTGATGSVITKNVVESLGLVPIGETKVFHANGDSIVNVYLINIVLKTGVQFPFTTVTEGILPGADLLIGMDIISKGDFSISNFGGETIFTFRTPSVESKDFVKDRKEMEQEKYHTPIKNMSSKTGRNEICHCGSGKKFKLCHGK